MISGLLKKIFGSRNERLIKQYSQTVVRINALEAGVSKLSDEALQAKTEEFRGRHAQGETLDALLPEAFAVVREAGRRVLGMRHFDMQLVGGMVKAQLALMVAELGARFVQMGKDSLNAVAGLDELAEQNLQA